MRYLKWDYYEGVKLDRSRRIQALDGLRGVCSLLVLIYHYQIYWIQALDKKTNFLDVFLRNLGFVVDVFFFMSGFIMSYIYFENLSTLMPNLESAKKIKIFLQKRLFRLYPIYFLCCVCTSFFFLAAKLFNHSFSQEKPTFFSIKILLVNLMGIQSWVGVNSLDATAWSLSIEFGLYIFFIIIMLVYSGCKINQRVFASFLFLLSLVIYQSFLFFKINENLMVLRGLGEFTIGMSIFLLIKNLNLHFRINRAVKSGYFLVLIFLLLFVKNKDIMYSLAPLLISPLVIICYFSDHPGRGFRRPIFVTLGSWSYSLYLIHPLFMNVNSGLHLPITYLGNRYVLIECLVLICMPIFGAAFCTKFIEAPIYNFLIRRFIR